MTSLAGFCLMNRDSRHVEIENDGTDQSAERVAFDPRPSTLALASVFKLCAPTCDRRQDCGGNLD